jgi:hypothetical protein
MFLTGEYVFNKLQLYRKQWKPLILWHYTCRSKADLVL